MYLNFGCVCVKSPHFCSRFEMERWAVLWRFTDMSERECEWILEKKACHNHGMTFKNFFFFFLQLSQHNKSMLLYFCQVPFLVFLHVTEVLTYKHTAVWYDCNLKHRSFLFLCVFFLAWMSFLANLMKCSDQGIWCCLQVSDYTCLFWGLGSFNLSINTV